MAFMSGVTLGNDQLSNKASLATHVATNKTLHIIVHAMPPPPKPKVRNLTTITQFFTAKPTPTVTATPSPPTTSTYYFIDVL